MFFEFFELPSLPFEALLVDAPLGGDAFVALLCAGAGAPRHHQAAVLPRLGGEFADRDFACGSGQYREEQAAAGFGRVGPAGAAQVINMIPSRRA